MSAFLKRLLNLLVMAESIAEVHGQAHFLPRNGFGTLVDAPVFDASGAPLEGPSYLAEIWGSADPETLTPLVQIARGNSRLFTPFATGGYFAGSGAGFLSVADIAPRDFAWLQVRVWDARLGATYEDVFVLGMGGYGESPLFYVQGGNPFDQFPEPGPLIGLQSFSLLPIVPEPSTWALLVGGTLTGWWAMRRRRL